jgi:hypothetical protein
VHDSRNVALVAPSDPRRILDFEFRVTLAPADTEFSLAGTFSSPYFIQFRFKNTASASSVFLFSYGIGGAAELALTATDLHHARIETNSVSKIATAWIDGRALAPVAFADGTNVQGVHIGPHLFSTLNGPVQVEYPRVYAQTCPQ